MNIIISILLFWNLSVDVFLPGLTFQETNEALLSSKTGPAGLAIDQKVSGITGKVIYVEDSLYDGLSDTEKIDRAISDAADEDAKLVFGNRAYHYKGAKTIGHAVNWKGSQTETYSSDETVIYITGRWVFNGKGPSVIDGIAIDAGRTFTGDVIRVTQRNNRVEFNHCHFMGALHRIDSDAAVLLNVTGGTGTVIYNNGSLSDAHSEAHIEIASSDGSTAGGWRRWPSVRGFNADPFDGYLEMKNVEIFNIGHEVTYQNGDKVWDHPREGGLNPGGWDIDAWQRSGRNGTGYTLLEDVRFYSSPGSFMKVSRNGGKLHFKNVDIHIREGEPVAGRPIRLQSYGAGHQRNGKMEKVSIRADRSRDLMYFGGGEALHMLMSFSGNEPDESFHIKDTVIEIGITEENPVYLENMAIFGYHRSTAPKHGLVIENTKVRIPGGIEWFFRTSANANSSAEQARGRVNQVTFRNNRDIRHVHRFYYAKPYVSSCSDCRVYTYHHVTLEGVNRYFNLENQWHHVEPIVSPKDIWRAGGGTFSGCECESETLDMYLFEINTKQ
jgi:hypothetical protein